MLCAGAVDLLCQLTHKFDPSLRLNGVWGLMNMSFNAEQKIKSQIMTTLGTDQVPKCLFKGTVHEIDSKNLHKYLQIQAEVRDAAGF